MITLPKAGFVAGASASQQVAVDQTGSALAGLGDRMQQLGSKWRQDKINRETRRAQTGITQDMALLRMEVDQLGDTTAIGPAWEAGVAEIRKRYVAEDQDPLLRENLGFAIDDLSSQHVTALAGRVVELSQSQDRADSADFAESSTKVAAGVDETTYAATRAQGLERIEAMEDAGQLTPEEAQRFRSTFLNDLQTPRIEAAIQADPAAALAALEAGTYADLSPDALARAQTAARAGVAAKAKAVEVATGQGNEAVAKQLDAMADMMDSGNSVQGMALLQDPAIVAAAATDPKLGKALNRARASAALQSDMPGIRTMTPAQLEAAIAAEEARPKDPNQPWDADRLDVLKKWRDQTAGQWAADPVAAAATAGLTAPNALAFDPSQPDAWANGLSDRLSLSSTLKAQGYTQTTQPFTAEERAQLKATLAPTVDPAIRLSLAQATLKGAGKDWPAAATAMGVTDTMRGAMQVLETTGDSGLAAQILSGEQKLATDVAAAPSAAELRSAFNTVTGGLFARDPAQAAVLMKAATAAYADVAPPADTGIGALSFDEDPDRTALYAQTVQRMLGATPDPQGELTIGGIQQINDAPVLLPRGVSKAEVQDNFDRMERFATSLDLPKIWEKASLTGTAQPDLTANPEAYLGTAQLVAVPNAPGLYTMQVNVNGRTKPIPTKGDPLRPYVFDLRRLNSAAQVLIPKPTELP